MNATRKSHFKATKRRAGQLLQRGPHQCELPRPDAMGRVRPRRVGQRLGLSAPEQWAVEPTAEALAEEHRPRNVGECPSGPCPWAQCRYHTAVEVETDGSLVVYRKGPWPGDKQGPRRNATLADSVAEEIARDVFETCALRLADRGGMSHAEVAAELDIDIKRVRQIEELALRKLRRNAERLGLDVSWLAMFERPEAVEPDWGV